MRAFFVALAILLGPATAFAETGPADAGCWFSVPSLSSSLPANVPGIPFDGGIVVTDTKLADDEGTVIPTHLEKSGRDAVVVLEAALVAGKTYTLTWTDGCDTDRTASFVASAAISFPKSLGTLTATAPTQKYGGCPMGEPRWLEQSEVSVVLHPALKDLAAVMKIDIQVDGAATGYGAYGSVSMSAFASLTCPAKSARRHVTATAQLAGGPLLEATPLDLDFTCTRSPFVCPKDYADAGASASPEGDDVVTSQGCHAGRAGEFFALPVLAALGLLRRRRA